MSEFVRRIAAVLGIVAVGACATLPEAPEAPRAPEEAPPRRAEPTREAPLRIGVVVSSTGSPVLQRYAELVLDGARVGAEQQSTSRRAVELVVRDDGGTAQGAARAVRELEQAGVRVIIGPLVEDALAAAAAARGSDNLLIISPTAVADPAGARNVYALNVVDTRGAGALGEYARRYGRVGILHARTPEGARQARAFADAYSRGGRGTLREAAFDPGATNLAAPLSALRQAQVEAVFFPGSERELQVVLPQIEFYGLAGVQLLGTEIWLSDAARSLPQRVLHGAIVATSLWRDSPDVGWQDFVSLYEQAHRRSLENAVPALGFDATVLAVHALTAGSAGVRDFRGATGLISMQGDSVTRRPFLVRIADGRLVPVN
jgi:ABC-type branched-subunit amino acid transport system substrate-binding protein